MKGFALVMLLLLCGGFWVHAQDTTGIVINKNATLYQDSSITRLTNAYKNYNRVKEFVDGYRIQVLYTNVRDEIYESKSKVYNEFPDLPGYVEYEPPNFKLRIGDFKTRLEATYYLQDVIAIYPGAFIVNDKIKAK